MSIKNKIRAVFDIIPASSEDLDLKNPPQHGNSYEVEPREEVQPQTESKGTSDTGGLDSLVSDIVNGEPQELATNIIAGTISGVSDPVAELTSLGASFPISKSAIPGLNQKSLKKTGPSLDRMESQIPDVRLASSETEELHNKILQQIRTPLTLSTSYSVSLPPITPVSAARPSVGKIAEKSGRVIAEEVTAFYQKPEPMTETPKPKLLNFAGKGGVKKNFFNPAFENGLPFARLFSVFKGGVKLWPIFLICVGILAYGFILKGELMEKSTLALNNLQTAGEDLKSFNFEGAADNFRKSYDDFSRVSQNLNFVGAGLAGIFSDIPGFDKLTAGGVSKLKSAKDISEAGQLIARSGQAMSEALASLSQTGNILDPRDENNIKPSKIISQIKNALLTSNKNFQKAKALLSDIDESVIPDDKKESFAEFNSKLPLLEEYLSSSIEYVEFLEGVVGIDQPKKYLLLFQNNSELRPTGGFPGTYGVVSFASGGLSDFFVNDVYNLDGQLKRSIIPPKQLQHITPTWGMRDSTWFIDFPTSAKKAMGFFKEEAGYGVNGVITINPDIVSDILGIVGSVNMPEYGISLDSENFLQSIQEEVEYGENRIQPKQVVVDFAPRFLEKLYSAEPEKWMKIFNILMTGLEEKDVLFYFNDKELENFSLKEGIGGEVKKINGDYLAVNLSNVKGSKTDAVTDSSITVDTRLEKNEIIHKVVLTRTHNGGDKEHGFYNRQNQTYVRILLPENAEIKNISGNDFVNFHPILNYQNQEDFITDRDLTNFESTFSRSKFSGVDTFEESGKKGIGFWMLIDPGSTKQVEFEYSVPFDYAQGKPYNFYFQKQPGLDWKNFTFKLSGSKDHVITSTAPELNRIGSVLTFDQVLKRDFDLKVQLEVK